MPHWHLSCAQDLRCKIKKSSLDIGGNMERRLENIVDNFECIGAVLDDENEPLASDSDRSEER